MDIVKLYNNGCRDFRGVNLFNAHLRNADLRYADLRDADLRYADLRSADLRYADLRNVNLRYADLHNADLRDAVLPSPQEMLLCSWGAQSDHITFELMLYDACNHLCHDEFIEFFSSGDCPYASHMFQRSANFTEYRDIGPDGIKLFREMLENNDCMSALELSLILLHNNCKM